MKWLKKILLILRPWKKISELENLLSKTDTQIKESYEAGYQSGVNWHLHQWMLQANAFYGPEPLNGDQTQLLMHLYRDGLTFQQALKQLRIAEGRFEEWKMTMN